MPHSKAGEAARSRTQAASSLRPGKDWGRIIEPCVALLPELLSGDTAILASISELIHLFTTVEGIQRIIGWGGLLILIVIIFAETGLLIGFSPARGFAARDGGVRCCRPPRHSDAVAGDGRPVDCGSCG